jgi:ATP-dependent RNA helicase DDX24/MAK5
MTIQRTILVEKLLPNWSHLPLPVPLYRALHELKFNQPTAIQERALSVEIGAMPFIHPEEAEEEEEWGGITDDLPPSVSIPKLSKKQQRAAAVIPVGPIRNTLDRDLVGVAQTGSGKTLAYGLPILSFILSSPAPSAITDLTADYSRLAALILAPTRELALQVRAALSEVAIRTNPVLSEELQDPNVNAPRKRERGRHVSVVALTGGMSVEKQKRQLSRGADILVATPGRLWDLIKEVRDGSSIREMTVS